MATSHIFRIMFVNQGKVYEVYARKVSHGELFGFIEVEELLFGERASVVLDPAEERIKGEFSGVKRTFLPMHSILRIDEVKKHGAAKITVLEAGATVAQLLTYGPRPEAPAEAGAGECVLVVPRSGTISPWSSKATDIARVCGLAGVRRIERGIEYRVRAARPLGSERLARLAPVLIDRMT